MSLIPKLEYNSAFPTTINFDYPPVKDHGEQMKGVVTQLESLSGQRQTKLNYIEATREIDLSFVSDTTLQQLQTFYAGFAALGKTFKWYDDRDSASYTVYHLSKLDFPKDRVVPVGPGQFLWAVKLVLRRIIGSANDTDTGDSMSAILLNNQATPLSLPGLLFDTSTAGKVLYEIRRSTDTAGVYATGELTLLKKGSAWDAPSDLSFGDDHGVTFNITSGGQVQYTSNNLAGTNYTGVIYFKGIKTNV